jgi:hypothetical protein
MAVVVEELLQVLVELGVRPQMEAWVKQVPTAVAVAAVEVLVPHLITGGQAQDAAYG